MLDPAVQSAKRLMFVGIMGIMLGGIGFLALMLWSGNYTIGGLVGWGCGFATVIYTNATRAIAILEAKIVCATRADPATGGMPGGNRGPSG
jgi:hypothetical protein